MNTSMVDATRRALVIAAATLIAAIAVSFSAPSEAHAFRDPTVVLPSHTGWVYTRRQPTFCSASYPARCSQSPISAWRWTGYSWTSSSLAGGTQVYAYPYSGEWHWVWTQRTGWLAVKTSVLDTGYRCTGPNCALF